MDILGPLPSGENLPGLVDYHSRWIEVDVVRETTSKIIIQRLIAPFARYGIPKGLWIVNSRNFVAYEIEDCLIEMGVEHRHTTSLRPRAKVRWKGGKLSEQPTRRGKIGGKN